MWCDEEQLLDQLRAIWRRFDSPLKAWFSTQLKKIAHLSFFVHVTSTLKKWDVLIILMRHFVLELPQLYKKRDVVNLNKTLMYSSLCLVDAFYRRKYQLWHWRPEHSLFWPINEWSLNGQNDVPYSMPRDKNETKAHGHSEMAVTRLWIHLIRIYSWTIM